MSQNKSAQLKKKKRSLVFSRVLYFTKGPQIKTEAPLIDAAASKALLEFLF